MLLVTKKKTLKLPTLVRKSELLTMFGLTFGFEKDQVRFLTKKSNRGQKAEDGVR